MTFRNFLQQQILNLVRHNRQHISYQQEKQEIFFFLIGCSRDPELNHEYPYFIESFLKENINVNLVLIDPKYKIF